MTCISKLTYLHAQAAAERLAAAVLLGFFIMHFGVAWSEVCRSRQTGSRKG